MTREAFIDPSVDQISALIEASATDPGPVVMVNLLKFGDTGVDGYLVYGEAVQAHLDRVGATILYAGSPTQVVIGDPEADAWWDAIILVTYPSRAAFVEMVTDPSYAAVGGLRTAALTTSALVATSSWLPLD